MQTVIGVVADPVGLASTRELRQGPTRPELVRRSWATPASEVRKVQPAGLPIDLGHNGIAVGEVVHLERDAAGRVWAVGHVHDGVVPAVDVKVGDQTVVVAHDLYWSASRISTEDYRDIVFDSVALTTTPARVSARPVRFLDGDLKFRREPPSDWTLERHEKQLLTRAAVTLADRPKGAPLIVHDPAAKIEPGSKPLARTAVRMEYRSAELAGVSTGAREIELVVAPCDSPATVVYQGRTITELFGFGAFAGAEDNPGRVRVNRDHDLQRTVGVATRLDPYADEGLVGTVKLARTALADESLALAQDDCLDCSAGFMIDTDEWQGDSVRRVTRGTLHHIALTPDPAYRDARVLGVRSR